MLTSITVNINPTELSQVTLSNIVISDVGFQVLQDFTITTKYDADTNIPSPDYISIYRGTFSLTMSQSTYSYDLYVDSALTIPYSFTYSNTICTYDNSDSIMSLTSNDTTFDINDIITIYDGYMDLTLVGGDDSYIGYYLLTLEVKSILLNSYFISFTL